MPVRCSSRRLPVSLGIVDCGTEGGNLCPVRCPFGGPGLVDRLARCSAAGRGSGCGYTRDGVHEIEGKNEVWNLRMWRLFVS